MTLTARWSCGIIAANHNGYGIDGIAPDSTIVSIKAADAQRHTYPEALACAFTWAVNHGVDIVNNSYVMGPWRYWDASDPEQAAGLEAATRAITFARSQGVAIFAAAANDDADNDHPAGQDLPHDGADLASTRGKRGVMVPQMIEGVNQVSAVARQGWCRKACARCTCVPTSRTTGRALISPRRAMILNRRSPMT